MSGGGSKSTSKPTYTAEQKETFRWMFENVFPQAEGKETFLTQLMAQRARDEAAKLQQMQDMGIQNAAGLTGMSAGQVGGLMQSSQQQMIQATLKQIMDQRMAAQQGALNMIAGIPMAPGQTSKEQGEDPFKSSFGRAAGEGLGKLSTSVAQAGLSAAGIPGLG